MKTNHTPGPWTYSDGNLHVHGGPFSLPLAEVKFPSSGAWDGQLAEQVEANARLIAAAPDLLAACVETLKQMQAAVDLYGDKTPATAGMVHAACLSRAAIAKANP